MNAREATTAVTVHLREHGVEGLRVISKRSCGRMMSMVDTLNLPIAVAVLDALADFDAEEINVYSTFVSIIHN